MVFRISPMTKAGKRPAGYRQAMYYLYSRAAQMPGVMIQAHLKDRILTAEYHDGHIHTHSYWRNHDKPSGI